VSVAGRSATHDWPLKVVLRMVATPVVLVALGLWLSLSDGASVAATILVLVVALLAPAVVIVLFIRTRRGYVLVVGFVVAVILGIAVCSAVDSPTVAAWITGFLAGSSMGFDVANRAWALRHPSRKGRSARSRA
jgi:MFS-type transporter involved in bile tolerance (Atg22 family)